MPANKPTVSRPAPTMFDNSLRWWVPSERDPREKYLVDLTTPIAVCSCPDSTYNRKGQSECKHAADAYEALGRALAGKLREAEKKAVTEKKNKEYDPF